MSMRKIPCLFLILVLISASAAFGADTPKPKLGHWDRVYDSLAARVKKFDTTVNLVDLRIAYSKSRFYNPYGDPGPGWRDSMLAARQRDDAQAILKFATKVIDSNFVDIDAHMLLGYVYFKTNNTALLPLERWLAKGLVKSIFSTGTGRSIAQAYQIISVDEERTIVTLTGLRLLSQNLVTEAGHQYDKLDLEDQNNGQKVTLYFNVDIQMEWMKQNAKMPKAG